MNAKSSKAAEALFKKQDQQAAMSEYDERQEAEREKSQRLRALRRAKEESDRQAAAKAAADAAKKPAVKKPAVKRRKKVEATADVRQNPDVDSS